MLVFALKACAVVKLKCACGETLVSVAECKGKYFRMWIDAPKSVRIERELKTKEKL